jgi:hypothetical protein
MSKVFKQASFMVTIYFKFTIYGNLLISHPFPMLCYFLIPPAIFHPLVTKGTKCYKVPPGDAGVGQSE